MTRVLTATQRISCQPDPPVGGDEVTICYDFSNLKIDRTTLLVTFKPPASTTDHDVTVETPCFTVLVPASAQTMVVEDESGISPDLSVVVD
jgi:hypothetical protein